MLVTDDTMNVLVGAGHAFEAALHSLIRAEAWACGIAPDQIDWDYRTNVPDGGKDVLIKVGNNHPERKFIPSVPSIWSAKSGSDGLSVTSLRKEVSKHKDVLSHLKEEGGVYVWCVAPAASMVARTKLRKEAEILANNHGFNADQIVFRFRDLLTAWFSSHVGVAAVHLNLPRGWKTLEEWKTLEKGFKVPWVTFGDRAELVAEVQAHLLGTTGRNVLHLSGWSGIGKSRTVLQSCVEESALEGALYFPNLGEFAGQLEEYLTRNVGVRAALVIDELDASELGQLESRLEPYVDRIRVVTIGSGAKGSVDIRDGVKEVTPPTDYGGVAAVIKSSDLSLTSDQATELAAWCEHDLRLALLLAEAYKQDPGLTNRPITSAGDVLKRILKLFNDELGDVAAFRERYGLLSLCLNVGNEGEAREETEYLSSYFSQPVANLDRAVAQAIKCGLGRQQRQFFEAVPRALARQTFESTAWPNISRAASEFVGGMPAPRMMRKFIERAHECGHGVRDEIATALEPWFNEQFPTPDISLVAKSEPARLFAAYTELNPRSGLRWLRGAIDKASADVLQSFGREFDGSGDWRGRRHIVWLCDHLAQFSDEFWGCEEILYKLAQYETEDRVSNNSRGVWQRFFRPLFSWTTIPFERRIDHLLGRLKKAQPETQLMIMEAAIGAIRDPVGETVPPKIVGGRLAPEEWRPKTNGDLRKSQTDAANKLLKVVKELLAERIATPRAEVINHLRLFSNHGCLDELRAWLQPNGLDESTLRHLRAALDEHIDWLQPHAEGSDWLNIHPSEGERAWAGKARAEAEEWRRALEPASLASRIRDVTARERWEHRQYVPDKEQQTNQIYEQLAQDTLEQPEVMDELWNWFSGEEPRSAFEFGIALGRLDLSFTLLVEMLSRLSQDRVVALIAGYLNGISRQAGALPSLLSEFLDRVADRYPEAVSIVTLYSDVSEAGFNRLIRLAPVSGPAASRRLGQLYTNRWGERLSDAQKARAVEAIRDLGREGDAWAYHFALELVNLWGHQIWSEFPEPLGVPVADILEGCLDGTHSFRSWDWQLAIKRLPTSHNIRKIEILTRAVTNHNLFDISRDLMGMLTRLAKEHPVDAMKAVGKCVLSPERELFFMMDDFGLFDAMGDDAVRLWVSQSGSKAARAIARYLPGPIPKHDDPLYVPPVTEWLLSEFEDDDQVFEQFRTGRNARQIYVGAVSGHFEGTDDRIAPYLDHPLRRVREWAQGEIDYLRGL
jgi:hypothetical protein